MLKTIDQAVRTLREGGALIYPTETFYALGCLALDPRAVERIFRIKSRPGSKPLPLIIGEPGQIEQLSPGVSPLVHKLTSHFWPGPLSVLVRARQDLPRGLINDQGLACVRLPSHPGARALCRRAGAPLVASSANVSGGQPPANPEEIDPALLQQADLFFDPLPRPSGGAPSTIVQIADQGRLRVLREGAVARETLLRAGFILDKD